MQSSYSLIKENRVLSGETKKIKTEYQAKRHGDMSGEASDSLTIEEARKYVSSYEKIGQGIIEEAKKKREQYLFETIERANELEKDAYEKGYNQGLLNGHEDGEKEALEKYIPQAKKEAQEIIENAQKCLKSAREDYNKYLEEKKKEILNLVLEVSKKVLNREILEKPSINSLVEQALYLSKGSENVIVKCNSIHNDELKKNIEIWKPSYNIVGEIFLLPDDNMKPGNAIIEKDSGIIEVGIDIGMEKIKNVLT